MSCMRRLADSIRGSPKGTAQRLPSASQAPLMRTVTSPSCWPVSTASRGPFSPQPPQACSSACNRPISTSVRWSGTPWQAGSPERRAYLAQVTFDNLKDPAERRYFKGVKTRLQLPKEQVDKVREVAGRLLREAPAFQRLLTDLEAGR